MTVVTKRISESLVHINGQPCSRHIARKKAICAHSGKEIKPGDQAYHPLGNPMNRATRWLASEIDALSQGGERDNG